jgi:hypothetical protein
VNEAWISARAGYGVVVTHDDYFLLEAENPAPPRECALGQLNNLQALATDVVRIEAGAFPFTLVREVLNTSWRQESALTLVLMALDRQLSIALRAEAAGTASRLLSDEKVRKIVRWRLLGTPLPEVADVEGAPLSTIAADLVSEAVAKRGLVLMANEAWDRSAFQNQLACKLSVEESARLRQACVLQGGFAALLDSLSTRDGVHFRGWLKTVREDAGFFSNSLNLGLLNGWYLEAFGLTLKAVTTRLEDNLKRRTEFRVLLQRVIDSGLSESTRSMDWIRLADRHRFPAWAVECLPDLFVAIDCLSGGFIVVLLWHRLREFLQLYRDSWRERAVLCDGVIVEAEVEESVFDSLQSVIPYLDELRREMPLTKRVEIGLVAEAMGALEVVEDWKKRRQVAARVSERRRDLLSRNGIGVSKAPQTTKTVKHGAGSLY